MRFAFVALFAAAAFGQTPERPLTSLPYTPSLDTTFMDRSSDPCVNFYQYACGNWNKLNPIPPDQAGWDVYGKLAHENQQLLWGVLQQMAEGGASRTANEQKIGDYFFACMNESAVAKAGIDPLRPALDAIAALQSKREMAALIAKQHLHHNSDAFFEFSSGQDFANAQQVIAFAAARGLGLPDRDYYFKPDAKSKETREKYVEHVAKMFELLGETAADAKRDADVVMSIETILAEASLTRVEKREPHNLFHKLKAAEFKALTPDFDWNAYFTGLPFPQPAVVNVTEPKFFRVLEDLLKTRDLAEWKTYLRWHLIHRNAPYLSPAIVNENFNFFSKHLRGVEQLPPRWKQCVRLVDRQLGEALGQVYVQKVFTPEAKQKTLEMTRQIEVEMGNEIRQLPWMSAPTKRHALEKLHAIVNKIGYPERWRDYSSVVVKREDFLGNVMRAAAFENRRQLDKIGKPVDRTEWNMTPPTVNAYYDPQMNDINFPAGVLQPPLFDVKLDAAPNYGDTGGTIGHELTHGFDDEGRQFDAKGNLRDWWTKKDAEEFEKLVNCVRDQYAQYTVVDDIKINSKLTSGEDVADLGGELLAWLAWKTATKGQKLESREGLTPEQRFFVGFAQWVCGAQRPENLRLNAITNPHSPFEYRVNGVVSNMPQFQEAFSCKVGQPMVRPNACKVW
jgi:endothelin-converting enzyme/putative endopeptidase